MRETGIRFSTMHEAYKVGVFGITKYTADGAVYIEAEGYPAQLERFKERCLKIAENYDREKIEIYYNKIIGYTEFNIID